MDYEQKYKEALERASMLRLQNPYDTFSKLVEQIFPELEESEDEKMKRLIISTITLYYGDPLKDYTKAEQMIDWLTKQWGNNVKPTEKFKREYGNWDYDEKQIDDVNKLKPKFNVDDWVISEVTGSVYQIKYCLENISNHEYGYEIINGGFISTDEVNHFRLWNLNDAKDGNILVSRNRPFIYNGKFNSVSVGGYCGIHIDDSFVVEKYAQECNWSQNKDIKPATKKQCDFLFQKMYKANYKWDDEKKELIPIK